MNHPLCFIYFFVIENPTEMLMYSDKNLQSIDVHFRQGRNLKSHAQKELAFFRHQFLFSKIREASLNTGIKIA